MFATNILTKQKYKTPEAILARRVFRKGLTQAFVQPFLEKYGDKKGAYKSKCYKQYASTYYCSAMQTLKDGKLVSGSLCKTKMCQKCAAIRCARLINGYEIQLQESFKKKELYFVTLTKPTVHYMQAGKQLKEYSDTFNAIRKVRFKRGKRIFKGLRKLEFTVRPDGHIHFHYHLLVVGRENAEWLRDEWLKRQPEAKEWCQDIRLADKKGLKELFKYVSKPYFKANGKKCYVPYGEYVDVFNAGYCATYKQRLVQPFGGLRRVSEEINSDALNAQFLGELKGEVWQWKKEVGNYVSELGELLSPTVKYPKGVLDELNRAFKEPPPYVVWRENSFKIFA